VVAGIVKLREPRPTARHSFPGRNTPAALLEGLRLRKELTMMLRSLMIAAMLATGGVLTQVHDADAAVRVRSTPNRTVVRYTGPHRHYRYGYTHVAPAYGVAPVYGYHYVTPGYGYYYMPGRTVIATPNRFVYRGPYVRFGTRW
jgi:hypothetical protein